MEIWLIAAFWFLVAAVAVGGVILGMVLFANAEAAVGAAREFWSD